MSDDWTWLDNKTWNDIRFDDDITTVGTVIEVREGKRKRQLLIGDINDLGGVCDDCTGISGDTKVLRWKRVTW